MLVSQHDEADFESVECEHFDKLVSQTVPGEPFPAQNLCSDRVLAAVQCSLHENLTLLSTMSQRCVWIFCSSRGGQSQSASASGASMMSQREFVESLPLSVELANMAATTWSSLFDTASSTCIALLLRQFEQQEQRATVITSGISSDVSTLLFSAASRGNGRSGACALWREAIPAILQRIVTLNADADVAGSTVTEHNVELFLASSSSNYITTSRRGLVVANMGGGDSASAGSSLTMTSIQQNCIVECCSASNPVRSNSYDVVYGDYNPACIVAAPLWTYVSAENAEGRNEGFAGGIIIRLYNSTISRVQRLVLTKTIKSVGKMMQWWLYGCNNAALTQIIDPLYVAEGMQLKADDQKDYELLSDDKFTSSALGATSELVRNAAPAAPPGDAELLSPFLSLLMDVYGSGGDVYSAGNEQSQLLLRYLALLFNSSWCLVLGVLGGDSTTDEPFLINNCGAKRAFALSETKQALHNNVQYWLNCVKSEGLVEGTGAGAESVGAHRADFLSAVETVRVLNNTVLAASGLQQLLQPVSSASAITGDQGGATASADSVSCSLLGFVLSSNGSALECVSKPASDARSDSIVIIVGRSFMSYEKRELNSAIIPAMDKLCSLYTQLCTMKANHIVYQQSLLIAANLSALESGATARAQLLEYFRQDLYSLYESMVGPHTGKSGYSVVKTTANSSVPTSANMSHQRFRRKVLHSIFKFTQKLLSSSPLAESSDASASEDTASPSWKFRVYLRDSYSNTVFELLPSGEYVPLQALRGTDASRVSSRAGSRTGSRASSPAAVRRNASPPKRVFFMRNSSPTPLQDSRRGRGTSDSRNQSRSHGRAHRYGSPTALDSPGVSTVDVTSPDPEASHDSPDSNSSSSISSDSLVSEHDLNEFVDEIDPLDEPGATNLDLYEYSYMGYESQYILQYTPRKSVGSEGAAEEDEFVKSPSVLAARHACAQADLASLQAMCQAVAEVADMNPSYFVLQHDATRLLGTSSTSFAGSMGRNSMDLSMSSTYLSPFSCLNLSVSSLMDKFSVSAQIDSEPSRVFAECVLPQIDSISAVFNKKVVMFPVLHLEREGLTAATRGERSHMRPLLPSDGLDLDVPSVPSKLKDYLKSVSDQHSCDNEFLVVSDVLASLVSNYVLEVQPQRDSFAKSELLLNAKCLLYTVPLTSPSTIQPTFGEETCSSTFIHILVLVPPSSIVTAIHLHYLHQLLHCFFTPMKMMQTMQEVSTVLATCTRFGSRVHAQLRDVYCTESGEDAVDVVSANSAISSSSALSMQYLKHCIRTVALEALQQVKQILRADNAVVYTHDPSVSESGGASSPVLHELVHFSTHMKLEISLPNTISARDDVLRHSYPVAGASTTAADGSRQWVTVDTDVSIEEVLSLMPNSVEAKALYSSSSHQIVRVLMQGVAMSAGTPVFDESGDEHSDGQLGSDMLSPCDKISTSMCPVIAVFAFLPVHQEPSTRSSSASVSGSFKPKSAATRFAMEQLRVIAATSCGLLQSLTHSALVQSAAEDAYKQCIYRSMSANIQGAEWSKRVLSGIVNMCRGAGVPHQDPYVPEELQTGSWPALARYVEQWNGTSSLENVPVLAQMPNLGSEAEFIASNTMKLLMELEDQLSIYKLQYETLTDKYKDLSKKTASKDHTVGGMMVRLMGKYNRESSGNVTPAAASGGIAPNEMEKKCVMLTNQVECDYQLMHRLLNLLSQYHPVEQVMHEIQGVGNVMMQNAINAYLSASEAAEVGRHSHDYVVVGLNYMTDSNTRAGAPFPLVGVRSLDLLNNVLASGKPVFVDASGGSGGVSSDVSISYMPVNLLHPSDSTKIVATLGVVQYIIPKKLEHSYFVSTAQQCIHCTITHCLSRYSQNQQSHLQAIPRPLSDPQVQKAGAGLGAFEVVNELCTHLFYSKKLASVDESSYLDQIYFDEKSLKLISKMIASVLRVDASLMVSTYLPHSSLPSIPTKGNTAGQSYKWSTQGYVARWLQNTDALLKNPTPSAVETLQVDDYCTALLEDVTDSLLSHSNPGVAPADFSSKPFVMKSVFTKETSFYVSAAIPSSRGAETISASEEVMNDESDNESESEATPLPAATVEDVSILNREKYVMAVPLELDDPPDAAEEVNFTGASDYQSNFLSRRTVISDESPSTCAFLLIESNRRLTEVDMFGVKSLLMVIRTLCASLHQRATITENVVQMSTASQQLTSLEHMMYRLMGIIEKQKQFGLFITDLYSVGSTSSSIKDISNHSDHSFAKNWSKVEELFQTPLKDLLQVHAIHGVVPSPPAPNAASPTRPSTGNMNYNSGGIMLSAISSSSNQSPQQIALLCLTANTPIYCKDGDLSSRLPCVYIPVYLAEDSKLSAPDRAQVDSGFAFESCYVLVVTFESVKRMQEFHYEDGGDDEEVPGSASDAGSERALGLDHMLVMEVARNVSIWCNYQSNITALEHNYQNSVDMTIVTERLLVGLDEVNQHLPSSASSSTPATGEAPDSGSEGLTISSIDALSCSMDFIFRKPVDNMLGSVRLHWLDQPTRRWLSSVPSVEPEELSQTSLQRVLNQGQWTTDANSAPLDTVITALGDYKHDLAHHNATTHLSKSKRANPVALRDAEWCDCKNMFVTDIVGNVITDQEFIDAGSKIWVVCNPVYKSVDSENLHHIDEDDDEAETAPSSGKTAKVDMLNITECLLEISIQTPLRYCSVVNGCLHTSLNNILLGIQSHCTSVISTVLQYQYTTAYIASQSRFMDMQKQCLDIFNECTLELSKEGGRIISLCTSMQKKLGSLVGVAATGIICTNTSDGAVLFDALNNFRLKEDKSRISSATLEDSPADPASASSANKNLFLSDINLNSTYKQLLLNYAYAEVQFQCYDVMGKMFVFSQPPGQQTNRAAQATPYMPNEDILHRRKTNISHLKLHDSVNEVVETLCKALGRRVYELMKGHKNKQLMLVKQEEVGSQRGKIQQKDDTIIGLETTKALLTQDIQHSTEELAKCKEKLRAEQIKATESDKQHKALSQQLRKVVADCKA